MKKVFITGITGFAGSHLADYLSSKNEFEITGTYLTTDSKKNIQTDAVKLIQVDLQDAQKVADIIESVKPDYIYHLAALPSPAESFKNPSEFLTNNISAEVNVLEAVKKHNLLQTRILIVASGDMYGMIQPGELPVNESVPLRPTSPYAVSKIAQDYLGLQYFISYGILIIRVRPFNHVGPRLSPQFVISAFSKQIAEIEKKKKEPIIRVGNLESKRDFTDVSDMVRAYQLILEKGTPGEVYNIGSGKSYKIADILAQLLQLSSVDIKVEVDQKLLRPSDIPDIVCDYSKLSMVTGWKPQVSIVETLKKTLDFWRNVV